MTPTHEDWPPQPGRVTCLLCGEQVAATGRAILDHDAKHADEDGPPSNGEGGPPGTPPARTR